MSVRLESLQNSQKMHATRVSLKRIVNNTIISIIGQIVTWTSTLILMIAYGRFLGDFKFGELYFAMTFVMLLGTPIESGYDSQIIRGVAEEPENASRYFSNVLLIKVGIWLIVYALALLIAWLLGYSTEVRILVGIYGFNLLSGAISSTFASLHWAFERVIFPVVGTVLEKGLSALIGFLLLKNGGSVQAMAYVLLGGSVVSGVWQAIWFFRLAGKDFVADLALMRKLVLANLPFLLYGVLGIIYYRIDTVLLSLMTNVTVVGWYGAGYRLFDTLSFLPNLVLTILYPVYLKLASSSDKNLKLAVEKSVNFLLFCSIPIATTMIVAAPNIIGFLYHRVEFVHTIPSLQALAPGLVFLYLNIALGSIVLTKKQDKVIPLMAAIALIFNLGLNLFFIPLYQHVGAAIVTSLTELLLFITCVLVIPRNLRPLRSIRVGTKAIIASLVMALAIWFLRASSIFVILPIAMLVYLGAATVLRTIPREDINAVYKAMRYRAQQASSASPDPQEEKEPGLKAGDLMYLTEENTVPIGAVYSITQSRLQAQRINTPHRPEAVETDLTVAELLSFADEETVPMKAIQGVTQHQAHQINSIPLDCQQETMNSRENITVPEVK